MTNSEYAQGVIAERQRIVSLLRRQIVDCEDCHECRVIKWAIDEVAKGQGVMTYRDLNVWSDGDTLSLTAYQLNIDDHGASIDYDNSDTIQFDIAQHPKLVRYFYPEYVEGEDMTDADLWDSLDLCIDDDAPASIREWALEVKGRGY